MNIATHAKVLSLFIDKIVQIACVVLLVLLVLDVWLGVLARYVLPFSLTFTEELARYLMIAMALLAVSCGIVHREHIGVEFFFNKFPATWRRNLLISFDVITFIFFATLFWYGLDFVERGFRRITMIYDIPKAYPFIIVPLASGLACIQIVLRGIHDIGAKHVPHTSGSATLNTTGKIEDEGDK